MTMSYPNWVFDPTTRDPDVVEAEEAATHAAELAEFGADVYVSTMKPDEHDIDIELIERMIQFDAKTTRADEWFMENIENYWLFQIHTEHACDAEAFTKRLIAAGFTIKEEPDA
jgi:hypothetical protein